MDDPFIIVKRPLVTEKNMARAESARNDLHVRSGRSKANKVQIRHAIEKLFKVGVVDVRTSTWKGLAGPQPRWDTRRRTPT